MGILPPSSSVPRPYLSPPLRGMSRARTAAVVLASPLHADAAGRQGLEGTRHAGRAGPARVQRSLAEAFHEPKCPVHDCNSLLPYAPPYDLSSSARLVRVQAVAAAAAADQANSSRGQVQCHLGQALSRRIYGRCILGGDHRCLDRSRPKAIVPVAADCSGETLPNMCSICMRSGREGNRAHVSAQSAQSASPARPCSISLRQSGRAATGPSAAVPRTGRYPQWKT